MTLLASVLAGLVFASSERDGSAPLDFILVGQTGVMVGAINWWQDSNGWTDYIVYFHGKVEATATGLILKRNDTVSVWLASPDTDEQVRIDAARMRGDIDRVAYLARLESLRPHLMEEFHPPLDEWIATVKARPVVDPLLPAPEPGHRKVGVILLSDGTKNVDALVLDPLGAYATVNADPWLESIGAQFAASEPLPAIVDFLAWAREQSTHAERFVATAEPRVAAGAAEGIALRCLRSTL